MAIQRFHNFDLGFQSDLPRDQLPPGVSYRMKNWLPRMGAALRRRGTTKDVGGDLNALGTALQVSGMAYVPHSRGNHWMSTANGNAAGTRAYRHVDLTGAGTALVGTAWGSGVLLYDRPVFHKDLVILTPAMVFGGSANAPQKYWWSGAAWAIAALGGSPPNAQGAASWGEYLILFNDPVNSLSRRMWFSGVGTPEVWPANNSIDMPEKIVAVVPKGNTIFVLGQAGTHIITGDTPPPGGNLSVRKWAFNQGCAHPRSVTVYKDFVIWANSSGVWKSDGASIVDLTDRGGISSFWRTSFSAVSNPIIAAGVFGHYLVVSGMSDWGITGATLICDLERDVWFEWTNANVRDSLAFATLPSGGSPDGNEHLLSGVFQVGGLSRIHSWRGCFFPDDATWGSGFTDADGGYIRPSLETPFYTFGNEGFKRFKKLLLNYSLQSQETLPLKTTFTVHAISSLDDTTPKLLTSFPPTVVIPTTGTLYKRRTISVGLKSVGVAFAIEVVSPLGNSMDARISELAIDVSPLDEERANAS